jgi:predicted ATP-grasp superfamily ATP-dependent carboligase
VVKPTQSWPEGEGVSADRLVCADATDAGELLDSARGMLASGTAALVQELVPGRREAVHLIAVGGQMRVSCAQMTVRTYPPLGGSSVLRRSIPLPMDTAAVADGLMGATGLTGYAEVEFRRDALGEPVLMEVNARLSASVEVAVRAGLDAPLLLWRAALGLPLGVAELPYAATRMRWLGGDLRWLVRAVREHGRPQRPTRRRACGAFLAEFLRPGGYDYLGWRDLRPSAVAVAGFVDECLQRRSGSTSDAVAARL